MRLESVDACEFVGGAQVYRAADVDALLASIRAAVATERSNTNATILARGVHGVSRRCRICGFALYDGVYGQNPACECGRKGPDAIHHGWMKPDEMTIHAALDALLTGG